MIKRSDGTVRVISVLFFLWVTALSSGCGKEVISHPVAGQGRYEAGPSSAVASSVVKSARAQIGKPYRWGGSSPSEGFDCSGLVWWVYHRHGISVPRPSWQQINAGRPVGSGRLQAGDILFFRIPGQGKSLHAGIYSGEGYFFIHSPKSGHRVREESMDKAYWRKYYIGARRVLGDKRK